MNNEKNEFLTELVEWPLICRDLYQHRWMEGPDATPYLWKQPFSAVRASGGYPGNADFWCLWDLTRSLEISPGDGLNQTAQKSYMKVLSLFLTTTYTHYPKVIWTTQPSTMGGPLGDPGFSTLDSTAELRNKGNNHQNNTRVSAETVRHKSAYIVLYLTPHNESINDDKNDDLNTCPRVSLGFHSADVVTIDWWWRHNDQTIVTRSRE